MTPMPAPPLASVARDRGVRPTELMFPAGLPGFPEERTFVLEPWGSDDGPFALLTSCTTPGLGFVVADPWLFHPDYAFDLSDETAARLGIAHPTDAVVLCVVTLGERPHDATINLLGPIVVHRTTHEACQAVLVGAYDVRAPLVAS